MRETFVLTCRALASSNLRFICACMLALLSLPAIIRAQGLAPRVNVEFSITQTTAVGQSVFVLGDIPELGNSNITRAIKLAPTSYPIWRATVSIPANTTYTFRYVLRNDGPGQTSLATNGTFLTTSTPGSTASQLPPAIGKVLIVTWDVANPAMFFRRAGSTSPFTRRDLERLGPSTNGRAAESQFFAANFLPAGVTYEVYFTANDGVSSRYPASGQYTVSLDGVFIQSGIQYSYVPAASPTAARRDYSPAAVPTIFSPQLSETRGYRVFLPRGYSEQPTRRYPVLYMHDGQNVFESGAFGSWNAGTSIPAAVNAGRAAETIVVALDNGPNRLTDYLPPTDVLTGLGRGDRYLSYIRDTVKPIIDANYRTLTDQANTAIMGSSMGGVISLYAVWDFTSTFSRGGLMSGAWQTCSNYLNRVRTTPPRNVRMWLDSGDAGTSSDNYWLTYNLRDYFIDQANPKFALSNLLQHTVGYSQQHNEAAWAARLPDAMAHLFPAQEEPNTILREVYSVTWDVDSNTRVDVEDLYVWHATPSDVNFDNQVALDNLTIERHPRRNELGNMARGQR